jgi:hypothetical protein
MAEMLKKLNSEFLSLDESKFFYMAFLDLEYFQF